MAKKKKKGLQVVGNIDFKDDKNGLKVVGKVDFDDNNNITNKTAFIQQQDIAPVKETGLFNDAKGSTLQKIGNTAVDATGNILKGGFSSLEGLADFGRYRAADVLDLFGANKKAKKVRETAKANTTEEIFSSINHILSGDLAGKVNENDLAAFKDIKEGSYLGDKGSQVFQGVGNSATNAALSALGGNFGGMTSLFMSAAGNAQSEAYQEGATDFQAGIYGALSGSVEAATEMMFGGLGKITQNLGFGTGALDDQLINRFTRKLSNTIAKNAVDLGLRSAGEGVEEVVAGFGNAILQKLTYMKDEDFSKLLKDQKLMDSFVSGALSSALMQAPTTLSATMQGRESSTGYTENEREVYNRELENRLKAEEKLTKRRRTQIEEQLNQDFERGYVNAQNIRDILGDRIDLQKDTRLAESFNEEARRTQAYENDVSKYDEKQAKVIQTAIDSGLLNNSNKTHDMVDLIAKLSADKGVDFDFTNNERIKDSGFAIDGRQVNGFVKDGTVNLNLESNQVLNKTVGHEITHVLEGTELYDNLQQSLKAYIGEKEWNNRISQLEKVYKDVKGANIENELTSDLVGEHIFNDENFIRNLSTRNPNLFQKIFDEIKYMVKIATAGSKEARDLEKVKRAFEKAYKETSKTQQGTQYSIKDNNNRELSKEQQEYFKDSKIRNDNGELEVVYHTTPNQFTVFDSEKAGENTGYDNTAFGSFVTTNRNFSERFGDINEEGTKGNTMEMYANITNPITHPYNAEYKYSGEQLDNIVENWFNAIGETEALEELKSYVEDGEYDSLYQAYRNTVEFSDESPFEYASDERERLQEKGYDGVEFVEGLDKDVNYNVSDSNEPVSSYAVFDSNQLKNIDNSKPTSNPDIRYSLTDNQGRELSKEQQEYFKDSKVRDENGNLQVMYNGRYSTDNVFNANEWTKEKNGVTQIKGYFATDSDYSSIYGDVSEYYLDIKNPLYMGLEDGNEALTLDEWKQFFEEHGITGVEFDSSLYEINTKGNIAPLLDGQKRYLPFEIVDSDEYWVGNGNVTERIKAAGYDGLTWTEGGQAYMPFNQEAIKNVDNLNPTNDPDIRYQLGNNEVAPTSGWNVRSEDVRLQSAFKDTIAPLQEQVQELSNTINELKESIPQREYRPLTEQEGEQLAEEYANRDISKELAPVSENLTEDENQRLAVLDLLERNNMLDEEHQYERDQLLEKANPTIPNEEATPGKALEDIRDENEVGKRSVKAYQYEHPEVKPYFQQEAKGMLSDLQNSQKGERFMFESPKQGQGTNWEVLGIKRFTSPEIADLLDSKYGYTYKDIEKGLKAIIEDHGAENIAVAKRIEFILDDNLRNGYTDWQTGMEIPPNQDYLNMLAEQEWNEYYDNIQEQYPLEPYTPVEENVPDYFSIEDEDVSDMKIDKDLQDMTADDIDVSPFLEGLERAEDNRLKRNELKREIEEKRTYRVPKDINRGQGIRQLQRMFTNEFATLDAYSKATGNKNIKYKTDAFNNYAALAETNINDVQTDINGNAIGRGLTRIFDDSRKLGIEKELNDYLVHMSNIDRGYRGKQGNYTIDESKAIVKKIAEQHPEVKKLAKEVYQYTRNARHNLLDAGRINESQSKALGRTNPHFVPYIDEDIEQYYVDKGEIAPRGTIKRAKGGQNLDVVLPVEEALRRYTYSQFKETALNDLAKEIIHTSQNEISIQPDTSNSEVDADHLYIDPKGYYLTAYEDGQAISTKISEEMYKTLNREMNSQIRGIEEKLSFITKPLQKLSQIRRDILTKWSPTFPATNFIKDVQDAAMNSKYTKDFLKYANPASYIKTMQELASNKGKAQQFRSLYGGGLEMGQYDIDSGLYQANKGAKNKNFIRNLASKVENFNELIELTTRYAEFKASLDNGASLQEAMYNAREVTTNFSRGGVITKALNRNGMTFLNASVQGFSKFIRNFSGENGAKGVVNSLAKAAILGIAPAVFNELAFGSGDDKDEEYEALPDYIKDNYYLIKLKDGNFVRIPKGRMLSVFGSAARRTLEYANGDEKAFEGFVDNAWTQIGFNNPEENNIFAPFIQAMGGRKLDSGQTAGKAWYGGDIIPSRLQKERPEDQYDASIDKFSIWLGQQTGISPYKINYVLDQYSGGIGDIVLPMMTPEAQSNGSLLAPITDKFTADSTTDNKYVSEFYDTKGKLYTGSKATDEDKLKNMYMNHISMEMSQLYAERREVQASDLPKKEKYAKSQEIKKEINRLAKIGLDGYNNIEVTGNYAVINDDMGYYKNANGEWKPIPQNDITYTESEGLTDKEKSAYYGLKNDIYNINKEYEDESLNASTEERKVLNAQKKNEIIDTIKSSNLDDNTKAYIYSKKYGDKKIQSFVNSGIDVNSYLDYKQQDFSADKDRNGKSISGSKKRKVFDYINSMNIPYEQKLILAKSEYNSFNQNNYDIINYIENSGMSYDERIELYKNLGFKVDGDSISW